MQRLLLIWLCAVCGLSFAYHLGVVVDPDVASPMILAERLLAGGRLYIDVLEINPPFFIWSYLPPVLLAHATGIGRPEALQLSFHAIAAVSLVLMWPAIRRRPWLALVVPLVMFVLPGENFGQREHMFVVYMLPWVLLRARAGGRVGGSPLPALWACLGLFYKPFFALVPLAVFACQAWQSRSLRPLFQRDAWIMGAVLSGYALVIILWLPHYLFQVLPSIASRYSDYSHDFLLLTQVRAQILIGLALGVYISFRSGPAPRAITHGRFTLLAAAIGGFGSYYVQRKGWEYHAVPALCFTTLYLTSVFAAQRQRISRGLVGCILLVAAVPRYAAPLAVSAFREQPLPQFICAHPGIRFGTIASSSVEGFPLAIYCDVQWTMRVHNIMLVTSAWMAHPDGRFGGADADLLQTTAQSLAEDIDRHKPQAIAVERETLWGASFDSVGLLSQIPPFRDAWAPYRRCRDLGRSTLWVRDGESLCR